MALGRVAFAIVGVGVLCAVAPLFVITPPLTLQHDLNLTSAAYDIIEIQAPAATGTLLRALGTLFSNSILGPQVSRALIYIAIFFETERSRGGGLHH